MMTTLMDDDVDDEDVDFVSLTRKRRKAAGKAKGGGCQVRHVYEFHMAFGNCSYVWARGAPALEFSLTV